MMTSTRMSRALALDLSLLAGAEPPARPIARRLLLGTRFRRQPLAPTARPCGLRGLTARRGQAKRGIHAMNADIRLALFNRMYDALGKGQLSDGKSRKKTLTCGASYKPPALPGDTY